MKSNLLITVLLLGFAWPALAQDEPQVVAELARKQIYEGESVQYTVTVQNVQNPAPPKLNGFDDFDVQPAGEQDTSFRQMFIINGRRRDVVTIGHAYSYVLTPRRAGQLRVPGPVAEVNGTVLQGNSLTLQVIAPQDQDVAILEISADRTSIYPMQPFTVTLNIAVKSLPSSLPDRNPVEVLPDPPALSIPWVDDERLDDGLAPETAWRRWLGPLQSRQGGFSINNLTGGSSALSLFFNDHAAAFLPTARRTRRTDRAGNEVGYWEFAFERSFTAKKVGEYSFGPVTLKGTFATGLSGGRLAGEQIYAVAKPLTVTVKDVPTAGRPDSYIGAVGQFQVSANLAPRRAKVGDPMTLNLTLTGQGTLESTTPPDLAMDSEIASQFKVYDATQKTQDGRKEFTYSLRPLHAGIDRFPPVPVSYFDVEREKYVTLRTDPISIEIAEAEQLTDSEIAMTNPTGSATQSIEASGKGIFANITDPAALVDESVTPSRWFMSLGGMAGFYVMVVLVTRQVQRVSGDKELRRRRAAPTRARRRLSEAQAEIGGRDFRKAADHFLAVLVGLVADAAGLPEGGMTSAEAQEQLIGMDIDNDLVQRFTKLSEACDGARYGASEASLHGLARDEEALLDDLIRALKKKKRL